VQLSGTGALGALAAVAPGDAWFGGYVGTPQGADDRAVLLRWNGATVAAVDDPLSQLDATTSILDVAASSGDDVWVLGRETVGSVTSPVVEEWNGTSWTDHPPQVPPGSDLSFAGISTTGPEDVWIVGGRRNPHGHATTAVEHWNGSSWRFLAPPNRGSGAQVLQLTSVAEGTRGDVWASGLARYRRSRYRYELLIDHWNGSAWTVTRPLGRSASYAAPSVAAAGPDDVWIGAAARTLPSKRPNFYVAGFHWNGAGVTRILAPITPIRHIRAIALRFGPMGLAGPDEVWSGVTVRICPVEDGDGGFSPQVADATPVLRPTNGLPYRYPQTVSWKVDPAASAPHEVRDASGLGLFDSGPVPAGGSFSYDLTGAGTYPVVDPTTGAAGAVGATIQIASAAGTDKGNGDKGFFVDAGQSVPQRDGMVEQVEIRTPRATGFVPWGTAALGGTGFSDSDPQWVGPGHYVFRARLTDSATGAATDWSPTATIEAKCCHGQVLGNGRGFHPFGSSSEFGLPYTWRVRGAVTGKPPLVADGSPMRLYRSPPLGAPGDSFVYTFKGAGTWPVANPNGTGVGVVAISPHASGTETVGSTITITAASSIRIVSWRQWQIQIERPGTSQFVAWKTGRTATFVPAEPGYFFFRARLWDTRLHRGIPWSPAIVVHVS